MQTLHKDQSGVAHLLLIVVFLVAFAGLGVLAYNRISSNNDVATSDVVDGDNADLGAGESDDEDAEIEKADAEAEKEAAQ